MDTTLPHRSEDRAGHQSSEEIVERIRDEFVQVGLRIELLQAKLENRALRRALAAQQRRWWR